MSDGGGSYIEAWLSRMRMRNHSEAHSLAEADQMRCEESRAEFQGRLFVLILVIIILAFYAIF